MQPNGTTKLNKTEFSTQKMGEVGGNKKKCSNWELTERRQTDRQTERQRWREQNNSIG